MPREFDFPLGEINLKQDIEQIFTKCNMSKPKYMLLYGEVYNICVTVPAKNLSRNDLKLFLARTTDLHTYRLSQKARGLVGEDLLKFYIDEWEDYRFFSKVLSGICAYLNRISSDNLSGERKPSKANIVYDLAMKSWQNQMYNPLVNLLTTTILKLIESERNGEFINTTLISSVVKSFIGFSLYTTTEDENLSIYKKTIESKFLEETSNFYSRESTKFLSENSISEYLKMVEVRLAEEEKRVKDYLHKSTWVLLMSKCKHELIENHLQDLKVNFRNMLTVNRKDDLARMFNLVSKVPNGLNEFFDMFESHIDDEGKSAIGKCGDSIANDPKIFVETILQVHNKYSAILSKVFSHHTGFATSFHKGCAKFVNNNYVTKMENSSSAKTPELVAKYCDMLLRHGQKSSEGNDIEETLNQIMNVFEYIDDKDVFQKHYSKLLAKRLIYQMSFSKDAEASMICKLQLACGMHYTSNLHRMFSDIAVTTDLNNKFRNRPTKIDDCENFDFGIQVLSSGAWPFQQSCKFTLPSALEKSIQNFTTFYNYHHSGRKLEWLYQLSKGELITNCFKSRYILQVSTFQIAVLMQFNEDVNYTIEHLEATTQIQSEYLIQVIQILLRSKLLICNDKEQDLKPTSTVHLFKDYKNKKLRVNLHVPMKVEIKTDKEATDKHIEQNRKILIQAAIVRILKARKELQHQHLIAEIFSQLSMQFKPKINSIKRCIDILIEKEYLERTTGKKDFYSYLA